MKRKRECSESQISKEADHGLVLKAAARGLPSLLSIKLMRCISRLASLSCSAKTSSVKKSIPLSRLIVSLLSTCAPSFVFYSFILSQSIMSFKRVDEVYFEFKRLKYCNKSGMFFYLWYNVLELFKATPHNSLYYIKGEMNK